MTTMNYNRPCFAKQQVREFDSQFEPWHRPNGSTSCGARKRQKTAALKWLEDHHGDDERLLTLLAKLRRGGKMTPQESGTLGLLMQRTRLHSVDNHEPHEPSKYEGDHAELLTYARRCLVGDKLTPSEHGRAGYLIGQE